METRGCVADYVPYDNRCTLWTSTQVPHFIRLFVGGALGVPESQFRVVSHDVGGGFGAKLRPYPEEYLATAASKITERPVKWIEDRTESLQATTHGRGQIFDVEVAAKRDGTLLGLRFTQLLDIGAYHGVFSAFQVVACLLGGGCYDFKAIHARSIGVFTNRMSTDPYRGAGRPEATHLIERVVDLVARELGMDPAEVRRKNFVKSFPHTNNFGLVYDFGDYEKTLDRAMANIDYPALRKRQEQLRAQGRYTGIGFSTYVEICGLGPSCGDGTGRGHRTCRVLNGARASHGFGDGVGWDAFPRPEPRDDVRADRRRHARRPVRTRSRSAMATPATRRSATARTGREASPSAAWRSWPRATRSSRRRRKLAAHAFEASEEDIVVDQGRYFVRGNPGEAKVLAELAFASYGAGLPEGMEQGLEAVSYFDPPNFVWPFGCHICAVEVDPETGAVSIDRYVAVDDCGNVINPMVVDGQLHGGIAQGISQALFEEVQYDDETGIMLTGTMLDYLVPTMAEMPHFELDRTVTPSPTNELGVKGIGEAGTIASSIAVINAITDALEPFGIKHVEMPARPDRLWSMIKEARA